MPETGTVRLHRVIRATPDRVYRAFLDPDAMVKWSPPHGFTGKVHEWTPASAAGTGCRSRTSAAGTTHAFGGKYLEMGFPNERLRYTDRFESPGLPGEMSVTISLRAVSCGTDLSIVQEGIPAVIPDIIND